MKAKEVVRLRSSFIALRRDRAPRHKWRSRRNSRFGIRAVALNSAMLNLYLEFPK